MKLSFLVSIPGFFLLRFISLNVNSSYLQNFKSKVAFEQHELNHPKTVVDSGAAADKMTGRAAATAGHVCLVCKKKVCS